jgi:Na+/H+-dicarboxylate symporter
MLKITRTTLAAKILIAMVAGTVVGLIAGPSAQEIKFIGDIWLNLMKMIMIPMVMLVVIKAISAMDSPKTLGRIGLKIVSFYGATTIFATLVGIAVTLLLKPGVGFRFEKATKVFETPKVLSFQAYIANLFSQNMFVSFYSGDMMQVLVIAILFGIAVVLLADRHRAPVREWFLNMSELCMSIVELIMKLAPIGVFCIMASSMGVSGLGVFATMGKMLGAFYLSCLLQVALVYLLLLWGTTGIAPHVFMKKSARTWVTAVSTCSSAAVIPVNLQVCDQEFGVSNKISSFSIPFGAQFNQDGGAILSCVVIIFSAQAIGVDFGVMELIRMVLICTLVSAGTGAIPGGGIVRLMISSAAFGMPLEIVAMVAAFYRLFDMGTTSMSVIGDLSATVIIDRWEKKREIGLGAAVRSS